MLFDGYTVLKKSNNFEIDFSNLNNKNAIKSHPK